REARAAVAREGRGELLHHELVVCARAATPQRRGRLISLQSPRSPRRGELAPGGLVPNDRIQARHYAFLAFLTLINVMNFVDRQLLASFANFIVPDLQLTNAEFGWLTGFSFIVFYVTMGLFMGVLADLVNRPRLVALGLTLWSLLTAASGAARG